MQLTNVVIQGKVDLQVPLKRLATDLINVRYDPSKFSALIWQHRKAGGNCLVFANGYINCNGACRSFQNGIKRLRRYARLLQKLGYCQSLIGIKLVSASASHKLEGIVRLEKNPV
ncbi:hypothetical protein FSP39_016367 [Pinctada imbricata]|uniref:Uncharacterized protein n=1 Tax=Pinctada imbricata TaxID=66713 RepID=A0AA88XGE2_PINIB|nr:hypothetical protein FSP39_016367 [Pinctada imbricata]